MLRAVLMDLDGTLTRFNLDYLGARRRALEELRKLGLYDHSFSEEMSIYFMLKKISTRIEADKLELLRERFYKILEDAEVEASSHADLLPGALDVLVELKKMKLKLGIVTNNGSEGTRRTLDKLNLNGFFDVVVTRDDCEEMKPDGGSVREALRFLDVEPDQTIFVGDAVIDVLAAKSSGVKSIAIPSGPFTIERLLKTQPDFFINSIRDLPELLKSL